MIRTRLQDGDGGGRYAHVTNEGALLVATTLSRGVGDRLQWSSGYFLDAASSSDIAVDGSSTEHRFCVTPTPSRHRFVSRLRLTMHDAQMRLDSNEVRRFASAAAAPGLTNGLRLELTQAGELFSLFLEPVKNILEYYRYADTNGVSGITDGITAGVDYLGVTLSFGFPLALEAGTTDELSIIVADDLTNVDLFEAEYTGYYEDIEDAE